MSVISESELWCQDPSGEYRFFEQQTSESRRQLEQAKRNLMDFTAKHGVVAATEQCDLTLQKLSEVDANYRQAEIEMTETQQRVGGLEAQLQKLPDCTTTQIRVADNPDLLKALKATLLDLQVKRTGLLKKFEPSHRTICAQGGRFQSLFITINCLSRNGLGLWQPS